MLCVVAVFHCVIQLLTNIWKDVLAKGSFDLLMIYTRNVTVTYCNINGHLNLRQYERQLYSCFHLIFLFLMIYADVIYLFSDDKDNGGCNFFEWCDAPSPGPANARSNPVFQSETSATDMLCPCGAGACLVLTTKTGKNVGRQFYRCPANQVNSAFLFWCAHTSWLNDILQKPHSVLCWFASL